MKARHSIAIFSLLLLLFSRVVWGQETLPQPDPGVTVATKITPGCTVSVTVKNEPGLSGTFTIEEAGEIRFTLADDEGGNKTEWSVAVKGKTTNEAHAAITESMKKYLTAPEVSVVIVKLPRVIVEITGPVQKPGRLEIAPGSHLSDALALALYKPNADLANIRILRKAKKEGEKPQTIAVDFAAFSSGASDDDPILQSGDKIYLLAMPVIAPPEELRYVRAVGEVSREVQHPFTKGMKVRDLLERAGGLKPTADREKMRLVRGADGKVLELDADKVEADDPLYNMPLSPNDLLIVGVRDQSLVVAVLGEVLQPSTLPIKAGEKLTLLEVVERAGGLTKQADARKGLLRKNFLRNPAQTRDMPIDLDKIKKGEHPNFEIEPGDAIMIPPRQRRPSFFQQLLPIMFRFLPFGI